MYIRISKYKIITPSAAYSGTSGFSRLIKIKPNEIHNETYISFYVDTDNQANSLLSYLKCKLPNFMLSLRKQTHNISKKTCEWIPLPPLDTIWSDGLLYKKYNLSKKEINIIENKMHNIKYLI